MSTRFVVRLVWEANGQSHPCLLKDVSFGFVPPLGSRLNFETPGEQDDLDCDVVSLSWYERDNFWLIETALVDFGEDIDVDEDVISWLGEIGWHTAKSVLSLTGGN